MHVGDEDMGDAGDISGDQKRPEADLEVRRKCVDRDHQRYRGDAVDEVGERRHPERSDDSRVR